MNQGDRDKTWPKLLNFPPLIKNSRYQRSSCHIEQGPVTPVVQSQSTTDVGSRNEKEGVRFAHLFENMMFGMENVPRAAHFKHLKAGGTMNGHVPGAQIL